MKHLTFNVFSELADLRKTSPFLRCNACYVFKTFGNLVDFGWSLIARAVFTCTAKKACEKSPGMTVI